MEEKGCMDIEKEAGCLRRYEERHSVKSTWCINHQLRRLQNPQYLHSALISQIPTELVIMFGIDACLLSLSYYCLPFLLFICCCGVYELMLAVLARLRVVEQAC